MRTVEQIRTDITLATLEHENTSDPLIKKRIFMHIIKLKNELARTNIAIKKGEWK